MRICFQLCLPDDSCDSGGLHQVYACNRWLMVTQVATYAVSRPREADCQDAQHNAVHNIGRRTCMNDVGSSQFRRRPTSRPPHGSNSGLPILCVLRASVVTKVATWLMVTEQSDDRDDHARCVCDRQNDRCTVRRRLNVVAAEVWLPHAKPRDTCITTRNGFLVSLARTGALWSNSAPG